MHYVIVNGATIPAIGFGTWTLKGDVCSKLVAHALLLGYRHLDTAAVYDNESAVGEGLRISGVPREDVFVTTKVGFADVAPGNLERSAEASLERLGLDTIDLLLIHWPNPAIPLAGSIRALNAVRDSGIVRHIGVSNFPARLFAEAVCLSDGPLVANQVESHPFLNQTTVHGACRAAGAAMIAYCPLGRGGALFEEAAIRDAAKRHGKSPAQIVLRWQVQQKGIVAIPRTSHKERLAENLDLFDVELSDHEMTAISGLRSRNYRICNPDYSPTWDGG
ncbi:MULTISPECIES: aldo/keto reductase [unclassified Mesorhizobium]|uniref:aldo/keto reductase n=1 Tax=unclassified Mesorhizobium TaxID=325217 RepID=UPI000FE2F41A|nr:MULTISPECIES: aldo/keto reductase [unclassified Mesorhizobium]RWQ12143.1 MAG: aldo/keto reductase [Mesorhizobium sp.]TGQ37770.1 aldo/keto reductase [Mesorhizobium sp. M4B.F.Ca.ET.214.01.1.1]TGQ59537.1 aldo/keto reductase [Mesorhizobium sp. M4B.F.Ca.ET.211.01.1.1]TGU34603.1 aldo/keto reductase [Mesorhizobium sp. M4B.F.Ca.ET.150.01.1.1]